MGMVTMTMAEQYLEYKGAVIAESVPSIDGHF